MLLGVLIETLFIAIANGHLLEIGLHPWHFSFKVSIVANEFIKESNAIEWTLDRGRPDRWSTFHSSGRARSGAPNGHNLLKICRTRRSAVPPRGLLKMRRIVVKALNDATADLVGSCRVVM